MKAYVINLDSATERLETFQARAAAVGLAFARFPAVRGAALADDVLQHWQSRARIWAPLSPGEIGCFLSHRALWQEIAAGSEPWVFVAEDDVVFSPDAAEVLATTAWLPAGVHLIKVETMGSRVELSGQVLGRRGDHALRGLKSHHNGTAGYLLHRDGARLLLDWTSERCEPVDKVMFDPSQAATGGLVIAQMIPALCLQDFHLLSADAQRALTSSIGSVRARREQKPRDRRLSARAVKFIRRAGRDVGRLVRRLTGVSIFGPVPLRLPPSEGGGSLFSSDRSAS